MVTMDRELLELRAALNQWDPAGLIAVGAPDDEYNDLVHPVLKALRNGGRSAEVAAVVGEIIRRDYELSFDDNVERPRARPVIEWFDAEANK
jgi:hypothetical protein